MGNLGPVLKTQAEQVIAEQLISTMQSLLMLTVVVCVVAVTCSAGEDGTCPMAFSVSKCCALANVLPSAIMASAEECKNINSVDKPPTTLSEMKVAFACYVECAFSKQGLVDADGKMDKANVTKLFAHTDAALVSELTALVKQCLDSYESEVDTSLECKSGSIEFLICFKRGVFLNCPRSISTESSECDELKAKAINCPNVPVVV